MDQSEKIRVAIQACAQHEEQYGEKVPDRLLQFWQTGEAFRYDRKCLPPDTDIPGFETGSFRLAATVSSWDVQSSLGGLDDAVVGQHGDWTQAKKFLPLYMADQSRLIVARVDDPACPVGWFEEETWSSEGGDYDEGVYTLSSSLDAFLQTLVDLDEATFEVEMDDEIDEELWSGE